jgi:hypothetical protein
MKTVRRISWLLLALMLALGITGVALAAENLNIPLNNATAPEGTDCPATGGPSWHFVISPNNGHSYFITFHLNLGDATTYDTSIFVKNGDQLDNVFVEVPSGKTLTSLIKAGSSADIWWDGANPEPAKFQLSHVCGGSQPPAQDLTVSKTANPSYTRTFGWKIEKSADFDQINTSGSATFNYTVKVTKDAGTDSGWAVAGTITVHNPNTFDVIGVNVTDGDCAVTDGTDLTVPAAGDATASYVCTFASNPGSGTNTATATWPDIGSPHTSATGTASYAFGDPTTVVNNAIDVTDTNGGSWHFADSGSVTYEKTYNDPAGTCTEHKNVATITQTGQTADKTVKVCVGANLTVKKDATPTFKRTFRWTIEKSADVDQINTSGSATFNYTVKVTKDAGTDSDWAVTGKITVKNPNDWEAVTADLSDVVDNGGTCTLASASVTVPASGSVEVGYSCTFTSNPGSGTNTATTTWDASLYKTPTGTASGTADYTFGDPTTVVNNAIDVTDTNGGSWHFTNSGSVSYPKTYNDPAGTCTEHKNVATITQTGQTADKTVKVCVGANLTVKKDATPTFKRTYNWDPSKAVDPKLVEQVGGMATFNYTVNVNQTGFTDSEWAVTGKITVNNPNDWEAITADLSDVVDNGGACTLASASVTVPASGSVEVGYSCTFTSGASGTNTATATWNKDAYYTPDGSASGTANFAFTTPTTLVNQTVTVTDTFDGVTTTLGTVTATDGTPYASATFTYSHAVQVPTWNCVSYTNRAVIVETGQSASQTVKVCGPAKTGALTMGFWQNKNGQAIITGQAKTGVCPSATWLRTYAPFQDLSATATCAQVGTYVMNIIKAANASGAAMNAMLKAQMLATALDVYFSNPALGGNKIGAPAAIGGVSIDLTKICKNIAGGCTFFENSSSVFGGTPKTVLEMLAYAASQSNVGGSLWYGQVKATQELAKDAFDAINNEKVFAP